MARVLSSLDFTALQDFMNVQLPGVKRHDLLLVRNCNSDENTLYKVRRVRRVGNTQAIRDLSLVKLTYSPFPALAGTPQFNIYGTEVRQAVDCSTNAQKLSLITLAASLPSLPDADTILECQLNPSGDDLRNACPLMACNEGVLFDQRHLADVVADDLPLRGPAYKPICPVCVGLPLTQEYHTLKSADLVKLADMEDFYKRLNKRRVTLGYPPCLNGSEEAEWELYPDAMEPNEDVLPMPTSERFISRLPRIFRSEMRDAGYACASSGGAHPNPDRCIICQEEYDDTVVELPCGHVFCDRGCIESWLKQNNYCPVCRHIMPQA